MDQEYGEEQQVVHDQAVRQQLYPHTRELDNLWYSRVVGECRRRVGSHLGADPATSNIQAAS